MPERRLVRREAACRDGGEGMTHCVVNTHPRSEVGNGHREREADVHRPQPSRCFANSRRQPFARGARRFCFEQAHATRTNGREYGDDEHDDAHSTYPLRHRPPEQQALGCGLNVGGDRCTSGREPRHRLEQRIVDSGEMARDQIGDCTDSGDGHPRDSDGGEHVEYADLLRGDGALPHDRSDNPRDDPGDQ